MIWGSAWKWHQTTTQYTTVPPKRKGVSVTVLKAETKAVNKQTGLGNILPRGKPCQRNPQPGSQLPLTLFGGQLLSLILGVVDANKGPPTQPTVCQFLSEGIARENLNCTHPLFVWRRFLCPNTACFCYQP